ncbi:MAG: hypothetical protein CSA62_14625 [Planctomycetota bacterium]|nr:MAG: hypothetical protein CSA62_14625 [Planctomycetota bacterium]
MDSPRSPAPGSESSPVYTIAPATQLLWLLGGLMSAALLVTVLAFTDFQLLAPLPEYPFEAGAATWVLGSLLLLRALIWPLLSYRAWRFGLRPHDVWLRHGVLWRTRRSVPRVRIQHVDVESGPLERLFGLATLVVYTAGTGDADARIPGLKIGSAEWLREELLPRRMSGPPPLPQGALPVPRLGSSREWLYEHARGPSSPCRFSGASPSESSFDPSGAEDASGPAALEQ